MTIKLLSLVILVFVSYSPVINGEFIWDDDTFLTNNPIMTKPDALKRFWASTESPDYFPLVSTSLWLQRLLWGLDPVGYHVFNIIIHTFNAIALWFLLCKLKFRFAWMAAAIFALHPVHAESVAWITEIKNLQSTLFFFLTLICYLNFLEKQKRGWYIASLLLYLMALFSKTSVVMLPLILLLYHWWEDSSLKQKYITNSIPFFVFSIVFSLVTIWFQYNSAGATGKPWSVEFPERVFIAGKAVWFYFGKLLFPVDLIFIYPRWSMDLRLLNSYFPAVTLVALMIVLWVKRKGYGRPLLAGFGYFVINLFPVLGFFNIYFMRYSFVADHWQYLASPGIIVLAVWLVISMLDQVSSLHNYSSMPPAPGNVFRKGLLNKNSQFPAIALTKVSIGFLLLFFLVVSTYNRAGVFQKSFLIWEDTLKKNPNAWMAHNNIGVELEKQNKWQEAEAHYKEAVRINPHYAPAHDNLGLMLKQKNKFDEAAVHFRNAIHEDPEFWESFNNLGYALIMLGKTDEAVTYFQQALQINPYSIEAHNNLANILDTKGKKEEARKHYWEALRINPDNAEIHNNIGTILLADKKYLEAIDHFRKAIQINPTLKTARNNLSSALELFNKNQAIGNR